MPLLFDISGYSIWLQLDHFSLSGFAKLSQGEPPHEDSVQEGWRLCVCDVSTGLYGGLPC
jgi:hypothetical protein